MRAEHDRLLGLVTSGLATPHVTGAPAAAPGPPSPLNIAATTPTHAQLQQHVRARARPHGVLSGTPALAYMLRAALPSLCCCCAQAAEPEEGMGVGERGLARGLEPRDEAAPAGLFGGDDDEGEGLHGAFAEDATADLDGDPRGAGGALF